MGSASFTSDKFANADSATTCGGSAQVAKRRKKLRSSVLISTAARRLWPRKTAAEVAARTGVSVRTAEYWLSSAHDMPLNAFFALVESEQGDAFLEVVGRSMSSPAFERFRNRLRDEIRRDLAAQLTRGAEDL